MATRKLKLGVLASHGGTNLQAIIDACNDGRLDAEVRVIISNNSGSTSLERAKREGIPHYHLSRKTHPADEDLDSAITNALEKHDAELVLLAGYMRPVGPQTLAAYRDRILNSHPALLPKFGGMGMYGDLVHESVLASNEDVTGVTIHIVDEEYDQGPVVAQCEVSVYGDDTLESLRERVQKHERKFWVETLQRIAQNTIGIDLQSESPTIGK